MVMKRIFNMVLAVIMLISTGIYVCAESTGADTMEEWAKEHGWEKDGSGYCKEVNDIHYSLFYGWIKCEDYDVDEPKWQISTISSPKAGGIVEILPALDGFPVTSVGKNTFCYNDEITECNLPDGIKLIEESAFYNCRNLNCVSLPDTVVMIDLMAFYSCPVLTELTIPASVEKIARNAFWRSELGQEGLEVLSFEGDAPKVSYAAEESGYSLTNLEGVKIFVNADANGWDKDIWMKYNLQYIKNILSFADIAETDWFYDSVSFNYERGIMTGLDETCFGPYGDLSRAQFVSMLYRMSDRTEENYEEVFKDIKNGEWYTKAVIWAYKNGIVSGYENGYFGIDNAITREEMVTMLYRYARFVGCEGENEADCFRFSDASEISSFAVPAMNWAVGNEIILGKENAAKLDPQGIAARAEGAVVMQRFFMYL